MTTTIIIVLGAIAANLFVIFYTWLVLIMLPADYFIRPPSSGKTNFFSIIRNILASIIIIIGLALLVLPGPGLLTILAGIMISKNRLKKKYLHKILQNKKIQIKIQDIRKKFNKEPFDLPC